MILTGALPRNRCHHVCERDPACDRAGVYRAVGHDVDHDASREAGQEALQAHAFPSLRRRRASSRLWFVVSFLLTLVDFIFRFLFFFGYALLFPFCCVLFLASLTVIDCSSTLSSRAVLAPCVPCVHLLAFVVPFLRLFRCWSVYLAISRL